MSASGSEVTRCVVLCIRDAWYLPLRVFVVQLECLVLSMCQCLIQWFERSVECSTVLRKRLRYMTYSKAIARAFVLLVCLTSPVVSYLAVDTTPIVTQVPETRFYEIPFGLQLDEPGVVRHGPVSVGKVSFAAFSDDAIVSAFRRTHGFSSCNCGCTPRGLCSDFTKRSPDPEVQKDPFRSTNLDTSPNASGSTDHDVPSEPRSQDLGNFSMSSRLDDRGVTVVQDFVNPACLDLLETAFMFDGSPDYSYEYDSSYADEHSYHDYSYHDQSYHTNAPYSYDAYYGSGKKGAPKGGATPHYRDPSRGIDVHAGFTTKQAPVLLRGCSWRDARQHLQKFLNQTELPSERAVPHMIAKSFLNLPKFAAFAETLDDTKLRAKGSEQNPFPGWDYMRKEFDKKFNLEQPLTKIRRLLQFLRLTRQPGDRNFEGFLDNWHHMLREVQKDELFEPVLQPMFLAYLMFGSLNLQGNDLIAVSEKSNVRQISDY